MLEKFINSVFVITMVFGVVMVIGFWFRDAYPEVQKFSVLSFCAGAVIFIIGVEVYAWRDWRKDHG